MAALRLDITGTDCGVDTEWDPGEVWRELLVPPGIVTGPVVADFMRGDHTGGVLGFWSIGPDLKKWIETMAGGAAGTVWVPVKCGMTCGAAFLWPGLVDDCKKCLKSAVDDSKAAAHEGVTEIDGLLWSEGDIQNANFTGIPHHVNPPGAKPFGGIWAVPNDSYDDQWGPTSMPDYIELVAMATSDLIGLSF